MSTDYYIQKLLKEKESMSMGTIWFQKFDEQIQLLPDSQLGVEWNCKAAPNTFCLTALPNFGFYLMIEYTSLV